MPSTVHVALVEMYHQQPSLAAELLVRLFGVSLPAWQRARLDPAT